MGLCGRRDPRGWRTVCCGFPVFSGCRAGKPAPSISLAFPFLFLWINYWFYWALNKHQTDVSSMWKAHACGEDKWFLVTAALFGRREHPRRSPGACEPPATWRGAPGRRGPHTGVTLGRPSFPGWRAPRLARVLAAVPTWAVRASPEFFAGVTCLFCACLTAGDWPYHAHPFLSSCLDLTSQPLARLTGWFWRLRPTVRRRRGGLCSRP